ncbi:ATP/GTP-binding protein [hydrothermal vent metagenome]|uniref:ATP/GTP-binding protein n=1 Tax=hydrothermal vent metagenome TaxID=652676 RepID=A0A3B0XGU2_9ZZZZ
MIVYSATKTEFRQDVRDNPCNYMGADRILEAYKRNIGQGTSESEIRSKVLKENKQAATKKAETIIKNTYRTLMTRGQKGCYLYCTDKETNDYFAQLAKDVINELTNEYIKK